MVASRRRLLHTASRFGRIAAAAALFAPLAAVAAPADRAGADRLKALVEDYVGRSAAGETPIVTVTPVGDDYEVAIDIDRLAAPIKKLGIEANLGRTVSRLTPKPDGTWAWRSDSFAPWTWSVAGQTGRLAFEGFRADGDFDPTLSAFTRQTMKVDRMTSEQTVPAAGDTPRIDVRRTDEQLDFTATAAANASGNGVDVVATQTLRSITETIAVSEGTAKGMPDMEATLKVGAARSEAKLTGFRNAAFLALWRHLVAHHDKKDFTEGQADLKTRLRDLGPLFERFDHTATFDTVEFETPVGFASLGRVEVALATAGATPDGTVDFRTTLSGLKVGSLFIPAWAGRLIPSDLELRGRATGWNAAAPLAIFLDRADFAADKPISDEVAADMVAKALPKGVVDIVFEGNRVASKEWDLKIDGRMTAGPAGASGTVTAKATGLEQAIAALRDPKAGDSGKQAADQLALALSLAEQKDGAAVWRIDFEGERVSVNGRVVSTGAEKAAPAPTPAPAPAPAPSPLSTGKQGSAGSTKAPNYKAGENPLGGSDADSIKRMFDEKSAKGGSKPSTKSSVKKTLDAEEE